jgi:uncharacterized membrane protein
MKTRRAGRWIFDLALLVAVGSALWMAVNGQWEPAFRFAVVSGLMAAPRAADVPAPFAGAFAVFLLLATWASVEHWYRRIPQFDVLVHVLTPGSLAAVGFFALVHWRLMPPVSDYHPALRSWAPVVWVTAVGLSAAVIWEFYEWGVEQVMPADMQLVGYTDTIVDLFAGLLGSVAAGVLVLRWGRRHPGPRGPAGPGEVSRPAPAGPLSSQPRS